MTRRLMEGSEAIAEAMVAAGCRFFAGYPMTPFTEVLEHMARKLPAQGGVCMNAESELEAVGMAWGAAATGTRAATGSVGQGLSLMQESLSEITLARIPLVVLNMSRGQSDYYQATRGGGHGDYRHLVLAPMDVPEAVELVQLAFHWSEKWRNPVLVFGDYYLAHVYQSVDVEPIDFGPRSRAVLGPRRVHRRFGSGQAPVPAGRREAARRRGLRPRGLLPPARRRDGSHGGRRAALVETGYLEGAEVVVVAHGTPGKYVRFAVQAMRADGLPVGFVRPISLFPFPTEVVAAAAAGARAVAVYENSVGQMIDDVRLAVLGRAPVHFIGGLTLDKSGFGIGPDNDVGVIRSRIEAVLREVSSDTVGAVEGANA